MTRRPCKKGLRKGKPVGPSVVKIEIASIVNLYEEQRAMNMNSNLHPRTKIVKDLVKSLEMEKADRKRKTRWKNLNYFFRLRAQMVCTYGNMMRTVTESMQT